MILYENDMFSTKSVMALIQRVHYVLAKIKKPLSCVMALFRTEYTGQSVTLQCKLKFML